MRIAVNTRLLLPDKLEGIGWFAHESLKRIVKAHPEHHFIFLFDRAYDQRFIYADNVEPVVVPPPTRHPLLYRIWFEYLLPRALRRHKADVFVSPDGFLSTRTNVPQLAVMHDLNFEHYPEDLPPAYSRYYRTWFPRFAKKAARIATVSGYSKQDIVTRYGIAADRVDVVHNGVGDIFSPLTEAERLGARMRFTSGDPYLVCVGAMHRRKNLANTFVAFDRLAGEDAVIKLLIVGERMFKDPRMEQAYSSMKHKGRVVFAGRLGQAELRLALGASTALVYASYFEGFGIPVAEAMKCGVPVIAANATSLPEVAGEAAVYCEPFYVEDIARAMRTVLQDEALRARLIIAGIERAQRYTWDRTAEGLWTSIERILAAR
ncbi:MAG: glycosyltransferase family 4 protein [Flavobacteriales bacterium]|nr:glycosyltransferase family 4 protein [Flavobacteriales bacterium]